MLVYLDHAALTPVIPEAAHAMARALESSWGHPSAVHQMGRRARAALDEAQDDVAAYLGCAPAELIFYPSATRALGVALAAVADLTLRPFVCTPVEHPAVTDALRALEVAGRAVRCVAAPGGQPQRAPLEAALDGAGAAVLAPLNHEMGTVPAAWLEAARSGETWLVVDAVQAAAWMDLSPYLGPRAFVVAAGQKLGGPPGAAVLRVPPELVRTGRVREDAGTPPWLAAIGMGAACRARAARRAERLAATRGLAEDLFARMQVAAPAARRNGAAPFLGPIFSVSVPGVPARALEAALDLRGVCVSRAAACRQGDNDVAPAVRAAYPDDPARAAEATRFSLGAETTADDLDAALAGWTDALRNLARA